MSSSATQAMGVVAVRAVSLPFTMHFVQLGFANHHRRSKLTSSRAGSGQQNKLIIQEGAAWTMGLGYLLRSPLEMRTCGQQASSERTSIACVSYNPWVFAHAGVLGATWVLSSVNGLAVCYFDSLLLYASPAADIADEIHPCDDTLLRASPTRYPCSTLPTIHYVLPSRGRASRLEHITCQSPVVEA